MCKCKAYTYKEIHILNLTTYNLKTAVDLTVKATSHVSTVWTPGAEPAVGTEKR